MKNLFALIAMFFSLQAFSAPQVYWIDSGFCGEMDPFVVGDACLLEVSSKNEHFYVLTDFELPMIAKINPNELDMYELLLDKRQLKRATKRELEAMDRIVAPGEKLYRISASLLRFRSTDD